MGPSTSGDWSVVDEVDDDSWHLVLELSDDEDETGNETETGNEAPGKQGTEQITESSLVRLDNVVDLPPVAGSLSALKKCSSAARYPKTCSSQVTAAGSNHKHNATNSGRRKGFSALPQCVCIVCGLEMGTWSLHQHIRARHFSTYKPISCPFCNQKFPLIPPCAVHVTKKHCSTRKVEEYHQLKEAYKRCADAKTETFIERIATASKTYRTREQWLNCVKDTPLASKAAVPGRRWKNVTAREEFDAICLALKYCANSPSKDAAQVKSNNACKIPAQQTREIITHSDNSGVSPAPSSPPPDPTSSSRIKTSADPQTLISQLQNELRLLRKHPKLEPVEIEDEYVSDALFFPRAAASELCQSLSGTNFSTETATLAITADDESNDNKCCERCNGSSMSTSKQHLPCTACQIGLTLSQENADCCVFCCASEVTNQSSSCQLKLMETRSCRVCHRNVVGHSAREFEIHALCHMTRPPFSCPLCGHSEFHIESMKKHTSTAHANSNNGFIGIVINWDDVEEMKQSWKRMLDQCFPARSRKQSNPIPHKRICK